MQRDLLARRPSEYDCLLGAALRLADESAVPVPAFRRLDAMIRSKGLLA
jgi:2-dehydropantoate 2-reductase